MYICINHPHKLASNMFWQTYTWHRSTCYFGWSHGIGWMEACGLGNHLE